MTPVRVRAKAPGACVKRLRPNTPTNPPTKATFPFLMASGSIDAGHEAAIILMGDAAVLMSDTVVDSIHGVGFPPLKELVAKSVENKVPIFV